MIGDSKMELNEICKQLPVFEYVWHLDGSAEVRPLNDILMDVYDALPESFTSDYTIMRSGKQPWHVFYMRPEQYWEFVGTYRDCICALAEKYLETR